MYIYIYITYHISYFIYHISYIIYIYICTYKSHVCIYIYIIDIIYDIYSWDYPAGPLGMGHGQNI